jgi:O-antigen/teichoic acid export membrane protein
LMLPRASASYHQHGKAASAKTVLNESLILCAAAVLALSLGVSLAEPVLPAIMGSAWAGLPSLLLILAAGTVFTVAGYPLYWHFLAIGAPRELLWGELPGRMLLIVAAVAVAPMGAEAVAIAVLIGNSAIWTGVALFAFARNGGTSRQAAVFALRIAAPGLLGYVTFVASLEWSRAGTGAALAAWALGAVVGLVAQGPMRLRGGLVLRGLRRSKAV